MTPNSLFANLDHATPDTVFIYNLINSIQSIYRIYNRISKHATVYDGHVKACAIPDILTEAGRWGHTQRDPLDLWPLH